MAKLLIAHPKERALLAALAFSFLIALLLLMGLGLNEISMSSLRLRGGLSLFAITECAFALQKARSSAPVRTFLVLLSVGICAILFLPLADPSHSTERGSLIVGVVLASFYLPFFYSFKLLLDMEQPKRP